MLKRLKAYRILPGHRSAGPDDIGAMAELKVQIGDKYSKTGRSLWKGYLNPVMIYMQGWGCWRWMR